MIIHHPNSKEDIIDNGDCDCVASNMKGSNDWYNNTTTASATHHYLGRSTILTRIVDILALAADSRGDEINKENNHFSASFSSTIINNAAAATAAKNYDASTSNKTTDNSNNRTTWGNNNPYNKNHVNTNHDKNDKNAHDETATLTISSLLSSSLSVPLPSIFSSSSFSSLSKSQEEPSSFSLPLIRNHTKQLHEMLDLNECCNIIIFENLWKRLQYLEKWKELALPPEKEECDGNDQDLLLSATCTGCEKNYMDEYKTISKRCDHVRTIMNHHLPKLFTTVFYHDDDNQQNNTGFNVVPRPSAIPNAGLGLFYELTNSHHHKNHDNNNNANEIVVVDNDDDNNHTCAFLKNNNSTTTTMRGIVIPKNTIIGYYFGCVHNFHSIKSITNRQYLMVVQGDILVDPGPCYHLHMRFINDPSINFVSDVNCKFVPETIRSAVVTTRDIAPGEELFVSYGDAYWSNHGV